MTASTRELPPHKPLTLQDHAQTISRAAIGAHTAAEQLLQLAERTQDAPEVRPVAITAALQVSTHKSRWEAKSFGLLNTTPVTLYIGISGSARLAAKAFPVPPGALLILPVHVYDVEIGADPTAPLVADAVVFLLRFNSVQPAFLALAGSGGGGSVVTANPPTSNAATNTFATVGVASATVLASNAARKGLSMVNTSANVISLGLGAAAVAGSGIVLEPAGGSWDGRLGGTLWTGRVDAIASAAASNLAIVEAT